MIIHVTKKDIQKAEEARGTESYENTSHCPIAQAIMRRVDRWEAVSVHEEEIVIGFRQTLTPTRARKFINAFDGEEIVKPFRFKLDI